MGILSENWIKFRKEFQNILINKKKIKLSKNLMQIVKITKHKEGKIWTKNFILYNFYKKNKFLYPGKSLIKNIGFDGSGINSKITDIFYTKYFRSKKINSSIIVIITNQTTRKIYQNFKILLLMKIIIVVSVPREKII